jgi:hypothetical protein
MWRDLAARRKVPLRWIEVISSDDAAHRARLETRGVDILGFHEVTWADVLRRRAETDPWKDGRLVLDTVAPVGKLVERALAYVG